MQAGRNRRDEDKDIGCEDNRDVKNQEIKKSESVGDEAGVWGSIRVRRYLILKEPGMCEKTVAIIQARNHVKPRV